MVTSQPVCISILRSFAPKFPPWPQYDFRLTDIWFTLKCSHCETNPNSRSQQIQVFTCSEYRWECHHDPGKSACPAAAPGWQEWSQVLRDPASSHSAAASVSETPGNNRCLFILVTWFLVIKPPHSGGFLSSLQNICRNVSTCLSLCLFQYNLQSLWTFWLLKLNTEYSYWKNMYGWVIHNIMFKLN